MVQVLLGADRINLMPNPSFENAATTGWSSTGGLTIAVSTAEANQPPGVLTPGTHSLLLSNGGGTTVTGTARAVVPVPSGGLYTLSAYLSPQAGSTLRPVTLIMTALDANSNVLATVTGTPLQEIAAEWERASAQTPPTAAFPANTASIRVDVQVQLAAGEGLYIDDVLLEPVWALRPYFDADVMIGDPSQADYFWTNAGAKTGPSFYYRNYTNKIIRLYDVLSGIPRGATSGTPNTSSPLGSTPSPRGPIGQGRPMIETGFIPLGTNFSLVAPAVLSS
jgi:hypothetical protein